MTPKLIALRQSLVYFAESVKVNPLNRAKNSQFFDIAAHRGYQVNDSLRNQEQRNPNVSPLGRHSVQDSALCAVKRTVFIDRERAHRALTLVVVFQHPSAIFDHRKNVTLTPDCELSISIAIHRSGDRFPIRHRLPIVDHSPQANSRSRIDEDEPIPANTLSFCGVGFS